MQIQLEPTQRRFKDNIKRLEDVLAPRHSSMIIDDQLNIIPKWGITTLVLSILQYVVSWFVDYDLKGYLRATRVMEQIFHYCELNQRHLETNPDLACRIASKVFQKFNERTRCSHQEEARIHHDSVLEMANQKQFALAPPTVDDLARMGVSQEVFTPVYQLLTRLFNEFGTAHHYFQFSKEASPDEAGSIRTLRVYKRLFFSSRFPDYTESQFVEEHHLPFSLELKYQGAKLEYILAIFKRVIGQGSERKVRACLGYGIKGPEEPEGLKLLVRGRCSSSHTEERVLRHFQENPKQGLPVVRAWRTVPVLEQPNKVQFIQKLYPGNLFSFLGDNGFEPADRALFVVRDLTNGLKELHRFRLPNQVYIDEHGTMRLGSVRAFHADIASDNVLADARGFGILTDFGYSCSVDELPCKPGYMTPEIAGFLRSAEERMEEPGISSSISQRIRRLNTQYGQAKDVWCLGIVLLNILVGVRNVENTEIPDSGPLRIENLPKLQFIEEAYSSWPDDDDWNKHFRNIVADLQQPDLDADIDSLKPQFQQHHPDFAHTDELWNVLKEMLKLSPVERISSEGMFNRLDAILPTRA